jgi:uncharacterized hydantoinase/oxoprolinase family protein
VLNISFDASAEAVEVTVCADTHRLTPAGIEALAREIESVTLDAAAESIAENSSAGLVEAGDARSTQG